WDVHENVERYGWLPGSLNWSADYEWPVGDFGFVWGCTWGDESSWKIQFLDLSRIQEGIFHRDARFGYLELATNEKLEPRDFIKVEPYFGKRRVEFSVRRSYELDTGRLVPVEAISSEPPDADIDIDSSSSSGDAPL